MVTLDNACRTANGWDVNGFGQLKDGRGNICPVTVILPTLAMAALQKLCKGMSFEQMIEWSHENKDVAISMFMKILEKKISEAKDTLIERFNHIASQPVAAARFMWENNTMVGY